MAASPRPPSLIALQTEATILFADVIGQAGLASGFLGGTRALFPVHAVNAFVVLGLTVTLVITAVPYLRRTGSRWPLVFAVALLAVAGTQIGLGEAKVKGAHIFLGILFTAATTMLVSYLFRPGFTRPAART